MNQSLLTQRLAKLRRLLTEEGLDALLIANYSDAGSTTGFDHNLTYLTGLSRTYPNSFLLLTPDSYALSVDRFEIERAQGESWLKEVEPALIIGYLPQDYAALILQALRARVTSPRPRLGVNGRRALAAVTLQLAGAVELVDVGLELERVRVAKDALEIEAIGQACRIAEAGVQAIVSSIKVGISELELALLAEYEMSKRGAEYFWAGRTMVMTGPTAVSTVGSDSSRSDRRVAAGDLVHIDIFPSYQGYMSDIARTLVVGRPTPAQQEVVDVTFNAFERAVSCLKAGVKLKDLKGATFARANQTKYRELIFGPGHGIGLNEDLYPRLRPDRNGEIVFEDGMAIAIEVYTMVPGVGGVRYEDNFIVRGDDPLRLTKAERLIRVD
jgi:Xaa-Pro aminopeptidase